MCTSTMQSQTLKLLWHRYLPIETKPTTKGTYSINYMGNSQGCFHVLHFTHYLIHREQTNNQKVLTPNYMGDSKGCFPLLKLPRVFYHPVCYATQYEANSKLKLLVMQSKLHTGVLTTKYVCMIDKKEDAHYIEVRAV